MNSVLGVSVREISRELVRHLRAGQSQAALSKALGFTTNVVYTWESGRRFPELSVFLRSAQTAGVPVKERLLTFLQDAPADITRLRIASPQATQRLTQVLVGQAPKREVAQRVGVDRTTLARWLSGRTEPRLPEFLSLVDATTQRLLPFVSLFADPASLPSTRAAFQDLVAQQKLAYDLPWSHAILRALELKAYRALPHHEPGFLGRQIGIDLQQEERYLAELDNAGQIRWDGGRWVVHRVLTVDTRQDPDRNRRLKAHWARTALERLETGSSPPDALFSFNLFAVSEDAFQRIHDLHLEYYDRVRAIVGESASADRVALLNLQLLPLEEKREA